MSWLSIIKKMDNFFGLVYQLNLFYYILRQFQNFIKIFCSFRISTNHSLRGAQPAACGRYAACGGATLYSSGTVKRDNPYSDDDAKEETKATRKVRKLTN